MEVILYLITRASTYSATLNLSFNYLSFKISSFSIDLQSTFCVNNL